MTNPKSRIFAAVAGVLAMGATAAWAADATQEQKIQDLQAKVAALESKQAQNGKDMAATIDGVLRDAERRSQLMATMGDASAGYDNGFFIRAGDAWVLRPGALFQFRGVADYRNNTAGPKSDEWETGFEITRMKLILEGSAFTKDLTYLFVWDNETEGGSTFLEDAWVRYMFADDWAMRAGQFKDPFSHEQLISDGRLMAADRSLTDAILGTGQVNRTQGVSLIYGGYAKNNPINVEVALTDGANQLNTDYTKHAWDFGVAARGEYKAMGDWNDYADFTAKANKADLLVIGLGGDWSQSGDGNQLLGTLDAQWENTSGWGVYGGLLVQHLDDGLTASGNSVTNWGGIVQVSYLFNPQWEVFGRFDGVNFDNDVATGGDNTEDWFYEVSAGVNYYLGANGSAGHRAKITVDVTWLPNGAPGSFTNLGILGDSRGDNEVVARGQFQLWL